MLIPPPPFSLCTAFGSPAVCQLSISPLSSLPLLANLSHLIFTVSQLIFILFDLLLYYHIFYFIFTLGSPHGFLLSISQAGNLLHRSFYYLSLLCIWSFVFLRLKVGEWRLQGRTCWCAPPHAQLLHLFQVPPLPHWRWHSAGPPGWQPGEGRALLAGALPCEEEENHTQCVLPLFLQGKDPSLSPLYSQESGAQVSALSLLENKVVQAVTCVKSCFLQNNKLDSRVLVPGPRLSRQGGWQNRIPSQAHLRLSD